MTEVWPVCYGTPLGAAPPVCSELKFVFTSNEGSILSDTSINLRPKILKFFKSSQKNNDWYLTSDLAFRHLFLLSETGVRRSWVIIAGLSITLHDDHIYLRRIHVREKDTRSRLGTFLVSAAQRLFSKACCNLAVEIRHPRNKKQYEQALQNTTYLFYVHGLHFQPVQDVPCPVNVNGLFDHINANSECHVNQTIKTSLSQRQPL